MKKIHLNFAHNSHHNAQRYNSESALKNGFDISYNFSLNDIDTIFYEKNRHILEQKRGAGYWLWKSYFILKILNECEYGDIIFYTDSGCVFISPPNPLFNLLDEQDIVPFVIDPAPGNRELLQTKRDCFILMSCDSEEYTQTYAIGASFILLKKTVLSENFVKDYLHFSQIEKCITDIPSTLGEEYPDFNTHRHDQSIYSLLCKKYKLKFYRDPSQWGNPFNLDKEKYNQIIEHTRYNG
jgi:hypothetical protein